MEMWKAFRRFVEDFSALDMAEIPSLVIWEHYLVYATVLGIADKVIEQLAVLYPEAGQPATSPFTGWAWLSGGQSTAKSFAETLHSVTRSLQNSVAAAMTTSGAGGGGGFSDGGGGGGGGGGGRAG